MPLKGPAAGGLFTCKPINTKRLSLMDTIENIARVARHLFTEYGQAAESVALARAKSAQESSRPALANTWCHIAAAVEKIQAAGSLAGVSQEPR
jgi:hypothetical protein